MCLKKYPAFALDLYYLNRLQFSSRVRPHRRHLSPAAGERQRKILLVHLRRTHRPRRVDLRRARHLSGVRHFPALAVADQKPQLVHDRHLPDRDVPLPGAAKDVQALQRGEDLGQFLLHLRDHHHDRFLG